MIEKQEKDACTFYIVIPCNKNKVKESEQMPFTFMSPVDAESRIPKAPHIDIAVFFNLIDFSLSFSLHIPSYENAVSSRRI
jgi:hypothetical protein